jgi:predicted DsbA family dithiol-disulfide isomerase
VDAILHGARQRLHDELGVRAPLVRVRIDEAVRADEAEAAALGATGVPFFVIDEKYGVSGAQPTELFAEILEKAWGEKRPAITTIAGAEDAEACGPDGCPI